MSKIVRWAACDCKNGKHGFIYYRRLYYRLETLLLRKENARREIKKGYGTHLVKFTITAETTR